MFILFTIVVLQTLNNVFRLFFQAVFQCFVGNKSGVGVHVVGAVFDDNLQQIYANVAIACHVFVEVWFGVISNVQCAFANLHHLEWYKRCFVVLLLQGGLFHLATLHFARYGNDAVKCNRVILRQVLQLCNTSFQSGQTVQQVLVLSFGESHFHSHLTK